MLKCEEEFIVLQVLMKALGSRGAEKAMFAIFIKVFQTGWAL